MTAASLLALVSTFSACSSNSGTATRHKPPSSLITVPRGWKTYTYGKAEISVPGDWVVHRTYPCVDRPAPGTLELGRPIVLSSCQAIFRDATTVTLSPIPAGSINRSFECPPREMNGQQVYVGPCTTSNPAGIVEYLIPALGVEAVGTGDSKENVTGPGAATVVGRVLHTLRRG